MNLNYCPGKSKEALWYHIQALSKCSKLPADLRNISKVKNSSTFSEHFLCSCLCDKCLKSIISFSSHKTFWLKSGKEAREGKSTCV